MEVLTQIHPVDVKNWVVRLVAIDETTNQVRIGTLTLDGDFDGSLSGADLDALIGTTGEHRRGDRDVPGPHRAVLQTAPYTLTVNDVVQPGG